MAEQITIVLVPPSRTSGEETFSDVADQFVADLPNWTDQVNAVAVAVENDATAAENSRLAAENAQADAEQAVADAGAQVDLAEAQVALAEAQVTLAQTAAAYKGPWASLVGAASMPYNVSHLGLFWALNENIANVTLEEPGTSAKWTPTTPAGHILQNMFNGGTPIQGWANFKTITEIDVPSAGYITETIKNPSNATFATRVTRFDYPTAGDITITTTCAAFSISTTETLTFDDPTAGDVTNSIVEA